MRNAKNLLFSSFIYALTALMVFVLVFVIFFIVREALPLFREVPLSDFLLGQRWMPIGYVGNPAYGIGNFILGTLLVSAVAMLFSVIVGVGTALYLACVASDRQRSLLYPFIDLLAGIPSVVYGFIGLVIIVKFFLKLGHPSGVSVLAAAILLSVMILPFLVSSISDTLRKLYMAHLPSSNALGVEPWHATAHVILPLAGKSILLSSILAISRAMGETMAVMMVMGNANLFPTLLGKGETIASLIALEMGTAEVGSTHYHALFAAGLILMLLLLIINTAINAIQKKVLG